MKFKCRPGPIEIDMVKRRCNVLFQSLQIATPRGRGGDLYQYQHKIVSWLRFGIFVQGTKNVWFSYCTSTEMVSSQTNECDVNTETRYGTFRGFSPVVREREGSKEIHYTGRQSLLTTYFYSVPRSFLNTGSGLVHFQKQFRYAPHHPHCSKQWHFLKAIVYTAPIKL